MLEVGYGNMILSRSCVMEAGRRVCVSATALSLSEGY